jgi:predicted Rossmann fold nucleotide-binding protein DprA/Smf involved in DNA uptake
MADFLDLKRKDITNRLGELTPQVDEYRELEAAVAALDGIGASTKTGTAVRGRGKSGRPPRSAAKGAVKGSTKRRRGGAGRRRGGGKRAAEALAQIQRQPGIAIPDLAAKMGIKPNYLYRVLPGLQKEGKIAKEGGGWHARVT